MNNNDRFECLNNNIWGHERYKEFRDDVERSRAAQIVYRRMVDDKEEKLEDFSKDELIRRVRQLNLLVLSVKNRASSLTERLESANSI